jgi:hypothetical protein
MSWFLIFMLTAYGGVYAALRITGTASVSVRDGRPGALVEHRPDASSRAGLTDRVLAVDSRRVRFTTFGVVAMTARLS